MVTQTNPTPFRQFRRRAVAIDAIQFDGSRGSADALVEIFRGKVLLSLTAEAEWTGELMVESTIGMMIARPNDWIIKYGGGGLTLEGADRFRLCYEEI